MRVLLLGATGRTGLLTLEALAPSHTITALARRPSALPSSNPSLTAIQGTPYSIADVRKAFASAPATDPIKAVISTLNNGRTSDNPWAKTVSPANFMAECVRNCLVVMREHSVRKIVVLGTKGVGSSRQFSAWYFKFVVDHSNLKICFDDHEEVQKALEAEAREVDGFRWTDVRAVGLSDGEVKGVKEWGNEGKGSPMFVTRKSVAGFLVRAMEGEEWDGKTPVISN